MVADALGVSPSTVSRALNPAQRGRIGAETVQRVRDAATAMGYAPHPWARSLRTKRTNTLGLVIPRLTDGVLALMFEAAEDRAREAGYFAVTLSTRDREGEQARLVSLLLERRVDGLILATPTVDDPSLDRIAERGTPFVLINRASGHHPGVRGDDELGGYLATQHLISNGHRRVGFVSGPMDVSTSSLRFDGYARAHREAGIPLDSSLVASSSFASEGGFVAAGQLLGRGDRPTAIFAVNDATAIGTLAAARDLGLRVPADLAVVGYNDTELAPMLQVPLSSVALPLEAMGHAAVDMLISVLAGNRPAARIFPPRLVVRASSRQQRAVA